MAHAADPAATDVSAKDVSAKVDAAKEAAAKANTFQSSAERSVRKSVALSPAERSKAAQLNKAAGLGKAAAAADAAPLAKENPGLDLSLGARGTSARGIELTSHVSTGVASAIRIEINWGDGSEVETEYTVESKTLSSKHTYAEVGAHPITVTVTDLNNEVSVTNSMGVTSAGSEFVPHDPTRLLDTRDGTGAASAQAVAPYGTTRVKVGGNSGIPADVTAVALNVTVTNAAADGHITAYASGTEQPKASNVNFVAGQTVPNLTIVPVGADGYVELANRSWGNVDLIADVTGYFTRSAANGYTSLDPARLVDSRNGWGDQWGGLPGGSTSGLRVAGQAGVPATGVTAVALNVTVTNPKAAGHLTVFPGGQQAPSTSNVNFTAGQTVANSVIVPVGQDGWLSFRNGSWNTADVIVDVVGYYSADSKASYLPVTPTRLHDSRDWSWPLAAQDYRYLWLSYDRPAVTAYVLNTTVTNTQGEGHLSVAPDPNTRDQYLALAQVRPTPPNSSNLNWTKGTTVPNLVQASTGKNGVIDWWNRSWQPTDLVIDMFGLYENR
ncbi:hypothetical protein J7F03_22045 [Streptomyces sp. ISL-43]|uniref:hypothetical protein n=1 Tax=Streptomyces sp. ISL-43 TaxID=2819183 RepID=UPI001BEAD15D|nr:hypothetical protein [Streptomyces sp. ISL-43]MBT2449712.1 hypothetical protein [Streptomyces sp. ISL-43]